MDTNTNKDLKEIIKQLKWADFVILANIFILKSDWKQHCVLSKSENEINIGLFLPRKGIKIETMALAQIKSKMENSDFEKYVEIIKKDYKTKCKKLFFIYQDGEINEDRLTEYEEVEIVDTDKMAEFVINTKLENWLLGKV